MLKINKKRKHTTLSLGTKCKILENLDNGVKANDIAKIYGIGRSTVHDIKNKREKIEEFVKKTKDENGWCNRKTFKRGEYPEMEKILYDWYLKEQVTGDMLQEKARQLYKEHTNKDDFKASQGWLDKFKRRFGICLQQTDKKALSDDCKDNNKNKIICEVDVDNIDCLEELVPHAYAVMCFETCIKWAEENGVSSNDKKIMETLKNRALHYSQSKMDIKDDKAL